MTFYLSKFAPSRVLMIEEAEVHVPNPAPDAPEGEEVEQLPGKRKKEKKMKIPGAKRFKNNNKKSDFLQRGPELNFYQ